MHALCGAAAAVAVAISNAIASYVLLAAVKTSFSYGRLFFWAQFLLLPFSCGHLNGHLLWGDRPHRNLSLCMHSYCLYEHFIRVIDTNWKEWWTVSHTRVDTHWQLHKKNKPRRKYFVCVGFFLSELFGQVKRKWTVTIMRKSELVWNVFLYAMRVHICKCTAIHWKSNAKDMALFRKRKYVWFSVEIREKEMIILSQHRNY